MSFTSPLHPMYPVITLRGIDIEMTGLGVIIGIIVMLFSIRRDTKQKNLKFQDFFFHLPIIIILTYGLGSYMMFLLTYKHILPQTIHEFIQIILPLNYKFYASGLILGLLAGIIIFVYHYRTKILRKKRLDIIYKGAMAGMSIVGIFLVLGDHMIGLITTNIIGISALTPYSEIAKFSSVYPVGLGVTISAILSILISLGYIRKKRGFGRSIPGWGIFLIGLGWTLIFQNHPKYMHIYIASMMIDLNQYILRSLGIFLLIYHYRRQSKKVLQLITKKI